MKYALITIFFRINIILTTLDYDYKSLLLIGRTFLINKYYRHIDNLKIYHQLMVWIEITL